MIVAEELSGENEPELFCGDDSGAVINAAGERELRRGVEEAFRSKGNPAPGGSRGAPRVHAPKLGEAFQEQTAGIIGPDLVSSNPC